MAESELPADVAEDLEQGLPVEAMDQPDDSEGKSRTKRNIITLPEGVCMEKDGIRYRKDKFGHWRPDLTSFQ